VNTKYISRKGAREKKKKRKWKGKYNKQPRFVSSRTGKRRMMVRGDTNHGTANRKSKIESERQIHCVLVALRLNFSDLIPCTESFCVIRFQRHQAQAVIERIRRGTQVLNGNALPMFGRVNLQVRV